MDIYIPPYIVLLCAGALTQGGYTLLRLRGHNTPFILAVAGAGMVLASAWLERDVLLGCGQLALLYILWRVHTAPSGNKA